MTVKEFNELLCKYDIPENAKLKSDSGWECDATDCDTVFYNANTNTLVFTQKSTMNGELMGYGSGLFNTFIFKDSAYGQQKADWRELI